MKIQTTIEKVEVEKITYIAEDGKEFQDKQKCLQYEKDLLIAKLKPQFKELDMLVLDDCIHEEEQMYLIIVNGKSDWNIIKAYFEDEYCDVNIEEPKSYPANMVFTTTDCAVYGESLKFREVLEIFKEYHNKVADFVFNRDIFI